MSVMLFVTMRVRFHLATRPLGFRVHQPALSDISPYGRSLVIRVVDFVSSRSQGCMKAFV